MNRKMSRRRFLTASVGGCLAAPVAANNAGLTTGLAEPAAPEVLKVGLCNPLLRTPLSLIIDDSCPVINKAYYWIKQRHEWRLKHSPSSPPYGWEMHYDKLPQMPNTVPASFAARWGEWCAEQGIRGKFSMVPFPAGMGRIDRGFPGFPDRELSDWLRVTKKIIQPNFDITPEMLTHTRVADLNTWELTEDWEQVEWTDPPVDKLTDYIARALELLKNAGIACEGVTSPGAFGIKKEEAYARAVLDASMRVNNNPRPFYFLHLVLDKMPDVPIWHAQKEKGIAVASIVSCAGDWFGATGYDEANADRFIAEDLRTGRVPEVLNRELPCIMVGHWPCFSVNDQIGFKVLQTVKARLDRLDPDRTKTIWMKNSEIGHYWMARQLSLIAPQAAGVQIETRFPTANFTLSVDVVARRIQVKGSDLRQVRSRRDFRAGTFLVEGSKTYAAFDLAAGRTTLSVTG